MPEISQSAEIVRKLLREKIDADEKKSMLWIETMTAFDVHLPFLKQGAPNKADIESSIIGQLDCSSLKEFIESEKGLGWSYNTYRKQRQAWGVLKEYPFLINAGVSYNDALKQRGNLDVAKPKSLDEYNQMLANIQAEKERKEAEKVSNLKVRVSELEQQLVEASAKLEFHEQQRIKFSARQRQMFELQTQQAKLEVENSSLVKELDGLTSAIAKLKTMTRWEHFKAFIAGKA